MQTGLFNIIEGDGDEFLAMDRHLSFDPFMNYLRTRIKNEFSIKTNFFESILHEINRGLDENGPLSDQNIIQFHKELRLIYASLNPPLAEEEDGYWAIGFPMGQTICFGTDLFYELFQHQKCQIKSTIAPSPNHEWMGLREKTMMLYSYILEKLYGFSLYSDFELIHSYVDASGLQKFYKINIDNSFVDIKVKGQLPSFDRLKIRGDFSKRLNLSVIETLLPLEKIQLKGFSILTIHDITSQQALDNIKNTIIKGKAQDSFEQVIIALRTLAGVHGLEFSLMPFMKLNHKIIVDYEKGKASVLSKLLRNHEVDDVHLQELVIQFQENPKILTFPRDEQNEGIHTTPFLKGLKDMGIADYVLIPVSYNKEVVGVVELSSNTKGTLDDQVISRVHSANALLAQLFKDESVSFGTKINEVIKDKFTSLQSAVQWKFNEEAWKYMQQIQEDKPAPNIADITFENVYPLYGAVDIRDSTVERNYAAFQDISVHLELLERLLMQLKDMVNIVVLDEMIFDCRQWRQRLNEEWMDSIQIQLYDFFNQEVKDILSHFKDSYTDSQGIISEYEDAIHPEGIVYKHRNALEKSFQLINNGLNGYLELFDKELQNAYPCYFEKFRSDGVEYDIYIGQSIAPDRKFNDIYLKNIRLWQLTSLAAMAKITHSMLDLMEKPLLTTQLIFVNTNPIDISFRTDERRFDVEGSYNIRYQIIKKRIDKVMIKDTGERLTQPAKIAIVYLAKREEREYLSFIQYLQRNGTLLDDLEVLELEELQGVKGLQALRVGVNLVEHN